MVQLRTSVGLTLRRPEPLQPRDHCCMQLRPPPVLLPVDELRIEVDKLVLLLIRRLRPILERVKAIAIRKQSRRGHSFELSATDRPNVTRRHPARIRGTDAIRNVSVVTGMVGRAMVGVALAATEQ
jgi:hypothetical protein